MNRRHFLATALAAPLAPAAVPAPVLFDRGIELKFDRIIEPVRAHSNLVDWAITAIHRVTGETRRISGTNPEDCEVACEAMAVRCPFPDWSRCIRMTRAYPPAVWEQVSLP